MSIKVNIKSTAKLVETLAVRPGALLLDGEEFPYCLADEPIKVVARLDGQHVAYLPVVAWRVEIGPRPSPTPVVNVYANNDPDVVAREVEARIKRVA